MSMMTGSRTQNLFSQVSRHCSNVQFASVEWVCLDLQGEKPSNQVAHLLCLEVEDVVCIAMCQ